MQLSISIEWVPELSRNLWLLARNFANTQEMHQEAIDLVDDEIQSNFKSQGQKLMNNPKRAPLSERTKKARERGRWYYSKTPSSPGILRWTWNLQDKKSRNINRIFGQLSMDMWYGGYHQRWSGKLPKRTIIELNVKLKAEIIRAIQTIIYKNTGGIVQR